MDGGRRFLRSLKEQLGSLLAPAYPRPAGAFGAQLPLNSFQPRPAPRAREAAPPREPLALPERAALDVVEGRDAAGRPAWFVRCYSVDDSFKDANAFFKRFFL